MNAPEQKVPEWAVDEALRRCGVDAGEKPFSAWRDRTYARAVELLAAHIAAHEEPPVDSVSVLDDIIRQRFGWHHSGKLIVEELAQHGIELTKSGEAA